MFATLEKVKRIAGNFKTGSEDQVLEEIILGVNSKIKDLLDRELITDDFTQKFNVYPTITNSFRLKAYPVKSIASVTLDGNELDSSEYRVDLDNGRLDLTTCVPNGLSILEVAYNGGMADTEAELQTNYASITYMTCMQVIFEFKRKDKLSSNSISINDGGQEDFIPFELMKELKRAIRPYRRTRMSA